MDFSFHHMQHQPTQVVFGIQIYLVLHLVLVFHFFTPSIYYLSYAKAKTNAINIITEMTTMQCWNMFINWLEKQAALKCTVNKTTEDKTTELNSSTMLTAVQCVILGSPLMGLKWKTNYKLGFAIPCLCQNVIRVAVIQKSVQACFFCHLLYYSYNIYIIVMV